MDMLSCTDMRLTAKKFSKLYILDIDSKYIYCYAVLIR